MALLKYILLHYISFKKLLTNKNLSWQSLFSKEFQHSSASEYSLRMDPSNGKLCLFQWSQLVKSDHLKASDIGTTSINQTEGSSYGDDEEDMSMNAWSIANNSPFETTWFFEHKVVEHSFMYLDTYLASSSSLNKQKWNFSQGYIFRPFGIFRH